MDNVYLSCARFSDHVFNGYGWNVGPYSGSRLAGCRIGRHIADASHTVDTHLDDGDPGGSGFCRHDVHHGLSVVECYHHDRTGFPFPHPSP